MKRLATACFVAAAFAAGTQPASAVPVDLELYLAQDVSGSVDDTDFALSRAGFAAAFNSVAVQNAIASGAIGSIAVKLVDFGNNVVTAVDWTVISDAASAAAFAAAVTAAARGAGTGIEDGQVNLLNVATADLTGNGFEGTRRVVDIASEGAESVACPTTLVCAPLQDARDAYLAVHTAINAIWLNDRDFFGLDPTDNINAFQYGSLNVIGGPGSFQVFAEDFTEFAAAIERKIEREIRGTPEPGVLALLGLGLGALGWMRRRTS